MRKEDTRQRKKEVVTNWEGKPPSRRENDDEKKKERKEKKTEVEISLQVDKLFRYCRQHRYTHGQRCTCLSKWSKVRLVAPVTLTLRHTTHRYTVDRALTERSWRVSKNNGTAFLADPFKKMKKEKKQTKKQRFSLIFNDREANSTNRQNEQPMARSSVLIPPAQGTRNPLRKGSRSIRTSTERNFTHTSWAVRERERERQMRNERWFTLVQAAQAQ